MTRSDKEINGLIKDIENDTGIPVERKIQIRVLKWTLEGEPCYSVEELEKIFKKSMFSEFGSLIFTRHLLVFLKDTKKVKEILGED